MMTIMMMINSVVYASASKVGDVFRKIGAFFIDPADVPKANGTLPDDAAMVAALQRVKWGNVAIVVAVIVVLIVVKCIVSKIAGKKNSNTLG